MYLCIYFILVCTIRSRFISFGFILFFYHTDVWYCFCFPFLLLFFFFLSFLSVFIIHWNYLTNFWAIFVVTSKLNHDLILFSSLSNSKENPFLERKKIPIKLIAIYAIDLNSFLKLIHSIQSDCLLICNNWWIHTTLKFHLLK